MTTMEGEKAVLLGQIQEAWGNWEQVERLARQCLEVDPKCFDAATALQAACAEIAAKVAEHEPWAASMEYISYETAARNIQQSVTKALEANRLVRTIAHELGMERTGR